MVDKHRLLSREDDAADANWGGGWHIPTDDDIKELCLKCKWKWTEQEKVKGMLVTGPNGNSIFSPAAGSVSATHKGLFGYYLSAALNESNSNCVFLLYFDNGNWFWNGHWSRYRGFTIRPVTY